MIMTSAMAFIRTKPEANVVVPGVTRFLQVATDSQMSSQSLRIGAVRTLLFRFCPLWTTRTRYRPAVLQQVLQRQVVDYATKRRERR